MNLARTRLCALLMTALITVPVSQAAVASGDHPAAMMAGGGHPADTQPPPAQGGLASGSESVTPGVPDPLEIGTVLPPSRDVAAVKRRQALATSTTGSAAIAATTLTAYATSGIQPVLAGGAPAPYQLTKPVTKARPVPSTSDGVPLRYVNGKAYDHPSNQAVWGIQQLESYRLTQDAFYVDRARAAAQHLIDTSVTSRGASWFPYPFDFAIAGDTSVLMPAPWYSAMAQGGALSLFVRLWAVTGAQTWRDAAERTLLSLSLAPLTGQPWVSHVDTSGYLWLEEYPRDPASRSERVLNGSIFAMYGLHDFWRLVPDSPINSVSRALAARLFDGGATTVKAYATTVFRAPTWLSRYSLLHLIRSPHYHHVHTHQLLQLQYLTARSLFGRAADLFRADYPYPSQPGTVAFAAGTHTAYLFDSAGAVTASMSRRLPAVSNAPNSVRRRIHNHGIFYAITKGAFAGWWVPESWPFTYQRSIILRHDYYPHRHVLLGAGTWTAYQYDSSAAVLARRSAYSPSSMSAPASASAIIHGQMHVLISGGRYAGYWLPLTSGVTLL